jgi:hypothetical protein
MPLQNTADAGLGKQCILNCLFDTQNGLCKAVLNEGKAAAEKCETEAIV